MRSNQENSWEITKFISQSSGYLEKYDKHVWKSTCSKINLKCIK